MDDQIAVKKNTLEIPSRIKKTNLGKAISMNMVFTFLYSFKAKLDRLPYLDNDCEKIIKKKVEILKVD